MGILNGNPKLEPLHEGEVFGVWSYIIASNGLISVYQAFINHAGDRALKSLLEETVHTIKAEVQQASEILKANGIALPPALPDRPIATAEDIPVGARFLDVEISAILSANIAQGLIACSQVMGLSIREDIGMMFGKFHTDKAQFGAKLLKLHKDKAWLIPPPLHDAPRLTQ